VIAIDRDAIKFLVIDHYVLVFRVLVTTAFIDALDYLTGYVIDELLPQSISGFLIDLTEGDPIPG
jgi:hypothetical protein